MASPRPTLLTSFWHTRTGASVNVMPPSSASAPAPPRHDAVGSAAVMRIVAPALVANLTMENWNKREAEMREHGSDA